MLHRGFPAVRVHGGDNASEAQRVVKEMRDQQAKRRYKDSLTLAGHERPDGSVVGYRVLAPMAAKFLMKVFYAARVCRPDLLRAITSLACTMTKWSADCDRRLHRLMCYVKGTVDHV